MRRIQDPTAVATRPVIPNLTGPVGYFTNGNPSAGVPATLVPDWWLTMVQEELCLPLTAMGLPLDGTATLLQAVAGRLIRPPQLFLASGGYVPPVGLRFIFCEAYGGGGGGGGSGGTGASAAAAGGGGSAGSVSRGFFTAAQVQAALTNTALSLIVGPGGAGGNPVNNGSPGGTTSVASLMTCPGGNGGSVGYTTSSTSMAAGAAPGALSAGGNLLNSVGGAGFQGIITNASSPFFGISGFGGASLIAPGGNPVGANSNGNPGGFGAGGGGACSGPNGAGYTGGPGGGGYIIIWEIA